MYVKISCMRTNLADYSDEMYGDDLARGVYQPPPFLNPTPAIRTSLKEVSCVHGGALST